MNKYISPLAIISTVSFITAATVYAKLLDNKEANAATKQDTVAIVWAKQGKYSQDIVYSSYKNKEWSKPIFITENKLNSATPTIAGDSQNNIWVMWSEANSQAAELRYRIKHANTGEWGEEKTLETGFGHNAMPSLIKDKSNRLWSFWAAVDGEDDEIFYSYWLAGEWQKPIKLAADNNVPDIEPKVVLTVDGYPEVSWRSFDMQTFKYRTKRAVWDNEEGSWVQLDYQLANPMFDRQLKLDVELPPIRLKKYALFKK